MSILHFSINDWPESRFSGSLCLEGTREEVNWGVSGNLLTWVDMWNCFVIYYAGAETSSMEQELRRFPSLRSTIAAATNEALERFRAEGKKTAIRLVDMEASYLTVEFFRRLPQEIERAANPGGNPRGNPRDNPRENPRDGSAAEAVTVDRYGDGHFRRIGSNVSSYVNMVSENLKNTIPKAVVHCQVKEAKQNLLSYFYTQIGKREV